MEDLLTIEGRVRVSGKKPIESDLKDVKYLVFYLRTKKSFNEHVFVQEIGGFWDLKQGAVIEKIAQNLFVSKFKCQEDYFKVKDKGPWTFHN